MGHLLEGSSKQCSLENTILRDEEIIEHPVDQRMITRRYTDEALSFIRKSNEQSKPFFLYLAHSMPHVPLYLPDTLHDPKSPYPYKDVIEHIDDSGWKDY